jgi:hypothetical protein
MPRSRESGRDHPDRVQVRLICMLDLERQLLERPERWMVRVLLAHPSGPRVVHVLKHDAGPLRHREDRVQAKKRCGIATRKEGRRYQPVNCVSHLVDIAQLVA